MTMVDEPRPIDAALWAYYQEQAASMPDLRPVRSASADPHWHVVQIVSGSEVTVVPRLKRGGFGLYYPMVKEMRPVPRNQLSRKQRESGIAILKPKIVPFLPGYLFVHFDRFEDDWHDIFSFAGVRGLWLNGNVPREVPDEMIERWMAAEVNGVIPGMTKVEKLLGFQVGDQVRIADASLPMHGEVGQIGELPKEYQGEQTQALDPSLRITLFVGLFKVKLSLGQIEKT